MRTVPSSIDDGFNASFKGGPLKPCVRATVQKLSISKFQYEMNNFRGSTTNDGTGVFTSAVFDQQAKPREIPNIESCSWSRDVDQDAAEMTLVMWNTKPFSLGSAIDPDEDEHFDRPGYYTFSRGLSTESVSRWGQERNEFSNLIAPDRIIRTYEGYGSDLTVAPELDENLVQTGVWRIDDVTLRTDGSIQIKCRDLASILMDQWTQPPVVPWYAYPLEWIPFHNVDNPDLIKSASGSKWFHPTYETDSNKPYVGLGYTDGNRPYVSSNGAVNGHKGSHAFDGDSSSYWLSVGNYTSWPSDYEYVQGKFSARTISAIKVKTNGGPYVCFVSVKVGGEWKGKHKIPYRVHQVDTNADIKYVTKKRVAKNKTTVIELPKEYANATAIRVTLHDLMDFGIGRYRWRGSLKDVQVLQGTKTTYTVDGGKHKEGNIGDFTDIIKMVAGWGGFYWPKASTGRNTVRYSDGNTYSITPPSNDSVLPGGGRIWGDLMNTGNKPHSDIGVDVTDNQPLMDMIRYVKDIVGFNFFIDELGGIVWRLQNLYKKGNYLSNADGGPNEGYTFSDFVEINEHQQLMDMTVTVSGRNIRERIFITGSNGTIGAASSAYNPWPSGLRRVGGWTDQNFASQEEAQIMADLIAVRSMFLIRQNQVTIPGYPKIQLDDQVRIYERTTSEVYTHYVKGIQSDLNNTTGVYKYTLTTNWLGESPDIFWAVDRSALAAETQRYLNEILPG